MDAQNSDSGKIKTALKELLPAYIISAVFCFMLFVFEPLLMYCVNIDDFWFDIYMMLPAVFGWFGLFFAGTAAFMTALYAVNKLIVKDKRPTVFYGVTLALFLLFAATYFQGNLFAKALPPLDGGEIIWSDFKLNDIPMAIAAVIILAAIIVLLKLRGMNKTIGIVKIATGALFVMMFSALVVQLISWNAFRRKDSIITTTEHFDTVSDNRNFIIFLTDAVGSMEFQGVLLDNPEYKEVFEDFTYYPDTLGCFPCTRDTLPVVLAGALNKNECEFSKFSSESYNSSPLFKMLSEEDYDITLYDTELIWYGSKNFEVKNGTEYKGYHLSFGSYFNEAKKYIMYKYLPYNLKSVSHIEEMNFNNLVEKYIWDDHTVYRSIIDNPKLDKTSRNNFKFIHIEGAHIPFHYDKDVNIIDDGDYETKIQATITVVNAYIERLKANGAYDNTVLIVMSDHGNTNLNTASDMLVRGNPMFMVKGLDEHHEFTVSDKPLSYLDLTDAYRDLLDGKTAEETFADIPDERERTYMWYRQFRLEDHIEEYVVRGKAWEWYDFENTGREYDL